MAGAVGAVGGAIGSAIYLSGSKGIDLIGRAWDNLWGRMTSPSSPPRPALATAQKGKRIPLSFSFSNRAAEKR